LHRSTISSAQRRQRRGDARDRVVPSPRSKNTPLTKSSCKVPQPAAFPASWAVTLFLVSAAARQERALSVHFRHRGFHDFVNLVHMLLSLLRAGPRPRPRRLLLPCIVQCSAARATGRLAARQLTAPVVKPSSTKAASAKTARHRCCWRGHCRQRSAGISANASCKEGAGCRYRH
jgi:hypothetical protein